jgi:hypothetical protein
MSNYKVYFDKCGAHVYYKNDVASRVNGPCIIYFNHNKKIWILNNSVIMITDYDEKS